MRRPTRILSSTVENANTTWPKSNHDGEAGIISHPGVRGQRHTSGMWGRTSTSRRTSPFPTSTTMRLTFRIRIGDISRSKFRGRSSVSQAQVMANVNPDLMYQTSHLRSTASTEFAPQQREKTHSSLYCWLSYSAFWNGPGAYVSLAQVLHLSDFDH
jgi:hypothetical protein